MANEVGSCFQTAKRYRAFGQLIVTINCNKNELEQLQLIDLNSNSIGENIDTTNIDQILGIQINGNDSILNNIQIDDMLNKTESIDAEALARLGTPATPTATTAATAVAPGTAPAIPNQSKPNASRLASTQDITNNNNNICPKIGHLKR